MRHLFIVSISLLPYFINTKSVRWDIPNCPEYISGVEGTYELIFPPCLCKNATSDDGFTSNEIEIKCRGNITDLTRAIKGVNSVIRNVREIYLDEFSFDSKSPIPPNYFRENNVTPRKLVFNRCQVIDAYVADFVPETFAGLEESLVEDLSSLKKLHLSENSIRSWPQGLFRPLTNLEELRLDRENYIDGNLFQELNNNLPHLKSLNIFGMTVDWRVKDLPRQPFQNMTNLKSLWMGANNDDYRRLELRGTLLEGLGNLRNLHVEDHYPRRRIESDVFGPLVNLERLSIIAYRDPFNFPDMPKLEHLTVSKARGISTIPNNTFAGLPSLKALNLSQNDELHIFEKDAFNNLGKLETLNLSMTSVISSDLSGTVLKPLRNLKVLDLSANMMHGEAWSPLWQRAPFSSPTDFLPLTDSLESLNVSGNLLACFDEAMCSVRSLFSQKKNRQNTPITILAEKGGELINCDRINWELRGREVPKLDSRLNIPGCPQGPIASDDDGPEQNSVPCYCNFPIPESSPVFEGTNPRDGEKPCLSPIFSSPKSIEITCSGNLTDLTRAIRAVHAAEYSVWSMVFDTFDFSNGTEIPANYFRENDESLKRLVILRCPVAILPKFETIPALESLTLKKTIQNGEIAADMFKGLNKLKILDLSDNLIETWPTGLFDPLGNLEDLTIGTNNTMNDVLVAELNKLRNLQSLELNNMNFGNFNEKNLYFRNLAKLEYLSLVDIIYFHNIASGLFEGLTSLETLDLSYSSCEVIKPGSFEPLVNLKELSITHTLLRELKQYHFGGLFNLERLELSESTTISFTEIPSNTFSGLNSLKYLDLNGNKELSTISGGAFNGLGKLRRLNLSSTHISELPAELLASLKNLKVLDLSHNPYLSAIPKTAFQENRQLRELYLDHSDAQSLSEITLAPILPSLKKLGLSEIPFLCDWKNYRRLLSYIQATSSVHEKRSPQIIASKKDPCRFQNLRNKATATNPGYNDGTTETSADGADSDWSNEKPDDDSSKEVSSDWSNDKTDADWSDRNTTDDWSPCIFWCF